MTTISFDAAVHARGTAPYWFSAFPFPPHHFQVHKIRGHEAISKPYAFEVTVTSKTLLGENIERIAVGHRATLVMRPRGTPRVVPGVVESVRSDGLRESGERSQTTFRLVPTAALLRHQVRSRIFQDVRLDQVVDTVLHAVGVATRWHLRRRQPVRAYITQYEESDLAFVHRLLAEAGIFYSFSSPADHLQSFFSSIAEAVGGPAADVASLVASASSLSHPAEMMFFGDDASVYSSILVGGIEGIVDDIESAVDAAVGIVGDISPAAGSAVGAAAVAAVAVVGEVTSALGVARSPAPSLSYMSAEGLATDRSDKVFAFVPVRRVRSDVAEYREFDPARPAAPLMSRAGDPVSIVSDAVSAGVGAMKGRLSAELGDPQSLAASFGAELSEALFGLLAERRLETYEHAGRFLFPDANDVHGAAQRIRRRRSKKRVTSKGRSGCTALAAGRRFRLEDHPLIDENGEHVIVSVEHRGDIGPDKTLYENSFRCVPASVAFVPSPEPRRSVQVLLTATVVGPGGEDVYVDSAGRIKVHFHWDRRGAGANTSCWIRCMQPWAGAGFGHQFIPRVGMEVAVVFEDGDPDKPIVFGSLPNGTHPVPFNLPAKRTQSGIRTQSTPGGDGHNELMFEDAARRERIYVRAQRDLDEEVNHDHHVHVKNDEAIQVGGNRVDVVQRHLQAEVHGDANIHHFGARIDVVDKSLDERVSGDRGVRVDKSDRLEVGGGASSEYGADRTTRVHGNDVHIVGQPAALRAFTLHTNGSIAIIATESLDLTAGKGLTIRCGKTILRIGQDGIELVGSNIRTAGESGSVEVGKSGVSIRTDKTSAHFGDKILVKSEQASLSMGSEFKADAQRILLNAPDKATDEPPPKTKPKTKVQLKDKDGRPIPNQRFTIKQKDGSERTGITTKDGTAELELAEDGEIFFPELADAQAS